MNPNLTMAMAVERQAELERQAGCCTPMAEHRSNIGRGLRALTTARRTGARPVVCCA